MKDCQFGNTGRVKEGVNSLADHSGSLILRDHYVQSFCRLENSAVDCIKGGQHWKLKGDIYFVSLTFCSRILLSVELRLLSLSET